MSTNAPHEQKGTVRRPNSTKLDNLEVDWTKGANPRAILVQRLLEKGISLDRGVVVYEGKKQPKSKNKSWARKPINHINGNYGVEGGNGLVIIDKDYPKQVPNEVNELPDTFEVESPHAQGTEQGHDYYHISDDVDASELTNHNPDWGEIRLDKTITLAPNSTILHKYCDNCGLTGSDDYTIRNNREIASLTQEDVDALVELIENHKENSSSNTKGGNPSKNKVIDETKIGKVEDIEINNEYINKFQSDHRFSQLAFEELMLILNGSSEPLDKLRKPNGKRDRSQADIETIFRLTGIYETYNTSPHDIEEALTWAASCYSKAIEDERWWSKDSNHWKWNRDDNYKKLVLKAVGKHFNINQWIHWAHKQHPNGYDNENPDHWFTNHIHGKYPKGAHTYSKITYGFVDVIPKFLAGKITPGEIIDRYKLAFPKAIYKYFDEVHRIIVHVDNTKYPAGGTLRDPEKPPVEGEPEWTYENGAYHITPHNCNKVHGGVEDPIQKSTTEGYTIKVTSFTNDLGHTEYAYLPEKSEVVEMCTLVDSRSEATYDTALKEIRRCGTSVLACMSEGVDYRVVPDGVVEPDNAEWVRDGDGKRNPNESRDWDYDEWNELVGRDSGSKLDENNGEDNDSSEWSREYDIMVDGHRVVVDGWVKRNKYGKVVATRTDPPIDEGV